MLLIAPMRRLRSKLLSKQAAMISLKEAARFFTKSWERAFFLN